jgi:hypothetical protein
VLVATPAVEALTPTEKDTGISDFLGSLKSYLFVLFYH